MTAETDRAAFNKAMASNAVPVAEAAPAPKGTATAPAPAPAAPARTSAPEKFWMEGRKPARSEDGKFAAAPVKEAEPAPAAEAAAEVDEDRMESARAALRAYGFRKKELDVLTNEEILKKGDRLAKRKEADDEAHRLAKLWREAQKAAGIEGQPKRDSQPAKVEVPKPDLTKLRAALSLDDEGAKTLEETFEQFAKMVSDSTVAPLRSELESFKKAQADAQQSQQMEMLVAVQAEVGKSFPDLLDPATFEDVTKEAVAISGSKRFERYANPRERAAACYRVACQNLELESVESDSKSEDRSIRRDARSTVSDRSRPAPTTPKEVDRHRFNDIAAKYGL